MSVVVPQEDIDFHRQLSREQATTAVARVRELSSYTVGLFRKTLDNAEKTYRRITMMNTAMFALGLGLVVAAAVYGAITQEALLSFVFGGLGFATVIALFLTGPISKTQTALSNLVQIEISFMNFFEQITFWDHYVQIPSGEPPQLDPAKFREASETLQQRAEGTVRLIQKYMETPE